MNIIALKHAHYILVDCQKGIKTDSELNKVSSFFGGIIVAVISLCVLYWLYLYCVDFIYGMKEKKSLKLKKQKVLQILEKSERFDLMKIQIGDNWYDWKEYLFISWNFKDEVILYSTVSDMTIEVQIQNLKNSEERNLKYYELVSVENIQTIENQDLLKRRILKINSDFEEIKCIGNE